MNKIILLSIIILIATVGSVVYATGEVSPPTDPAQCKACSSGSPQVGGYITWMSEFLTVIKSVPSANPGAIPGQSNNVAAKRARSEKRSQISQYATLKLTNQAAGVKSDMRSLNKLHQNLDTTTQTLINKKFQRKTTIDATTMSKLKAVIAKQVGPSKLLYGTGSLPATMTYEEFMIGLVDLHQQIADLPQASSGYIISRQGYNSNTGVMLQITNYYSCAQTVAICKKETALLKQTAASVKGYWGDIVKSWKQIGEATSKQYRTLDVKRPGSAITFGDGFSDAANEIEDIGANLAGWGEGIGNFADTAGKSLRAVRPGGGNWKKFAQNISDKRAATKAQKAAQRKEKEDIKKAQEAAKKSNTVQIDKTIAQPIVTSNGPSYSQGEIAILAAALNEATDNTLSQRVETQRYAINADSRTVTYMIPELTKQIYDTTQLIKLSANTVRNRCLAHCSNIPSESCGSLIQ